MVAIPVLGVAAGDVLLRSLQLDPGEAAVREVGQADVVLQWEAQSLGQDSFGGWSGTGDGKQLTQRPALGLLPAGSRTIQADEGEQSVTTPNGRTTMPVSSLVYDDPMLIGMLHQLSGRAPRSAGEIDVTTAALRHLGVRIGDHVTSADGHGSWLVVGTVRSDKATREERIYARPGAFRITSDNALTYVDVPGQMSWQHRCVASFWPVASSWASSGASLARPWGSASGQRSLPGWESARTRCPGTSTFGQPRLRPRPFSGLSPASRRRPCLPAPRRASMSSRH